jgi:hypothetical protein
MSRSGGLNQAKLTDQLIDLNKSVDIGILSLLPEPLVAVDSYVGFFYLILPLVLLTIY